MMCDLGGSFTSYNAPPFIILIPPFRKFMAGPKQVDKATKGLNALVDEFTSAVKELVNAGEETAVHLAVGGGRAISAIIDATGEVTKVTVETAGNVAGSIGSSVSRIAKGESGQEQEEETKEKN